MKELTIIIVTYNSAEIIEKSLSNLNAQKYDIAVVDNASLDNCAAIIAKKFPQIKLFWERIVVGPMAIAESPPTLLLGLLLIY